MQKLNVAILGASGFIGKNLMLSLPSNWNTFAFYNTNKDFPAFIKENDINAILIKKDLSTNFKVTKRYPKHFDLVISLLGNTKHTPEEIEPMYSLRCDPLAIESFFKKFSCKKLIYFSSTAIYENHYQLVSAQKTTDIIPSSPYTIGKYMSERLIHYFKKKGAIDKFLIVRLSGAYGPYQRPNRLITRLINTFHFKKGNYIELSGTGDNWTDGIYVYDVIDFILLAIQQEFKNEVIDFCSYSFMLVKEVVNTVINEVVKPFNPELKPQIKWSGKLSKENYDFYLSNNSYKILPPFNYKFKYNWAQGLSNFRTWLTNNPDYLPKDIDGN